LASAAEIPAAHTAPEAPALPSRGGEGGVDGDLTLVSSAPSSSPLARAAGALRWAEARLHPISRLAPVPYSARASLLLLLCTGCLSGFLSGLMGVGGPPLMVAFSLLVVDKDDIRAISALSCLFELPTRVAVMWRQSVGGADGFGAVDAALAGCTSAGALLGFSAGGFLRRFVAPSRPVLLRGLAAHWPVRAAWRRDALERARGSLQVEASAIPYARVFGQPSAELPLRHHIGAVMRGGAVVSVGEGEVALGDDGRVAAAGTASSAELPPPYVFDRIAPEGLGGAEGGGSSSDGGGGGGGGGGGEGLGALRGDKSPLLPWFLRARLPVRNASAPRLALVQDAPLPPSPQFYLGGPGSGAPMHFHFDAVNVLAHGEKQWLLRPPAEAEYSTVPAARFAPLARNGNGTLLACTQRGGDVLYVPYTWSHATVNLRTSVGFAVEFDSPLWAPY